MKVISVRMPEWAMEFIEKASDETSIPKSTLVRTYAVKTIRQLSKFEDDKDE